MNEIFEVIDWPGVLQLEEQSAQDVLKNTNVTLGQSVVLTGSFKNDLTTLQVKFGLESYHTSLVVTVDKLDAGVIEAGVETIDVLDGVGELSFRLGRSELDTGLVRCLVYEHKHGPELGQRVAKIQCIDVLCMSYNSGTFVSGYG